MKKLFLFTLLSLLMVSCNSDDFSYVEHSHPNLTTLPAQNVSLNQATLSGIVEPSPLSIGSKLQTKGFVWDENENMVLNTNKNTIVLDGTFGAFSYTITSLKPNTKYYYVTYAKNGNQTTYGVQKSFTTPGEALCSYTKDNYLKNVYWKYGPLDIDNVTLTTPSLFNDGNLEFKTETQSSIISIVIQLNEKDGKLPLTGNYNGVPEFNNLSVKSTNEVIVRIHDHNGYYDFPQGDKNDYTTRFYIKNDQKKITFIFCNTVVGVYVLNGQYSYNIPK